MVEPLISRFLRARPGRKLERLIHDARAAWCAKWGPALEIVADAAAAREKVRLRPPARTVWENPLEESFYGPGEGRASVEHPEVFAYRFANMYVTGSESMVFGAPHRLLRLCQSMNGMALRKIRRPIPSLAHRVEGAVLPLGGRGTGNRGHFLCEHLPRLLLAREHLGADYPLKILGTPGHAAWQAEYLGRLGEDPANLVEGSRGTVFCPDLWFVPNLSLTERADLYRPEIYREIARRYKRGIVPGRRDRQLFLTRKDAPLRRLVNEDEIFAACRDVFPRLENVSLAGMSLRDQVALFLEARVVLGAHNQAFRNLLYCEGALAIQLVPGERSAANEYLVWAANYDRLGLLHGNRCLSLYAGEPYLQGDWSFPLAGLVAALRRLERLQSL